MFSFGSSGRSLILFRIASALDGDRRAVVGNRFIDCPGQAHANAVSRPHPDNIERAALEHAWEAGLARADCERIPGFIPVNGDRRIRAFLVVVSKAIVFVEREVRIRSRIDAQFDRVLRFLLLYSSAGPRGKIEPARTKSGRVSSGVAAMMNLPLTSRNDRYRSRV